jgi:hypothetical protein
MLLCRIWLYRVKSAGCRRRRRPACGRRLRRRPRPGRTAVDHKYPSDAPFLARRCDSDRLDELVREAELAPAKGWDFG